MILAPVRNRRFGAMIPGTFQRTERGWRAVLDVGPNCSEDELMAAAHRIADRIPLRHNQVVLTYVDGMTAGLAMLHLNLHAAQQRRLTGLPDAPEFQDALPTEPRSGCLFEGRAWSGANATPELCGCPDCLQYVAERDSWSVGDDITAEIPITRGADPDALLSVEMDTSEPTPIIYHTGEDIQVLTPEDRGPRTPTEDQASAPLPTPSDGAFVGANENRESGGGAQGLTLIMGGGSASIAVGPWHRKYARPIVRVLSLGGSMTARQVGMAIGCRSPRIVKGTLIELEADGWVQVEGATKQGSNLWMTNRDPAEMPQEETA